MEKVFYSLHLREIVKEKFFGGTRGASRRFMDDFARATAALLRAAHDKHTCAYHTALLNPLVVGDGIITFNYDLVVERALKDLHEKRTDFGPWLYGFGKQPTSKALPTVHKVHGSMNWRRTAGPQGFAIRQQVWTDFDEKPGYRAIGPELPVLLPYWDKKVERKPWSQIWLRAATHLSRAERLVIWGYSLPPTDIKARELFEQGLSGTESRLKCVAVIDPSPKTRLRWRQMLVQAKFWSFNDIAEFLKKKPEWWE